MSRNLFLFQAFEILNKVVEIGKEKNEKKSICPIFSWAQALDYP